MSRRILVTGATGLAGSAIARHLRAAGYDLRLVVRRPEALPPELTAPIAGGGAVQIATADLPSTSDRDMARWFEDVTGVVHAAGLLEGASAKVLHELNVEVTGRLARASRGAEPARFVYLSSVSVYGEDSQRGTDESAPLRPESEYARSKVEGEAALAGESHPRTRALVLRPCALYGVEDRRWAPCLEALARRHRIPLVRGGEVAVPLLHADDLASAVESALSVSVLQHPVFNVANHDGLTWGKLAGLLSEIAAVHVRTSRLPLPLARALVRAGEILSSRSRGRIRPYLERWILEMACRDRSFSVERARTELGWAQRIEASKGLKACLGVR